MNYLQLAADATDPVSGAAGVFLQYGALGAIVLLLGLFVYRIFTRDQKRIDTQDEEIKRLNNVISDKMIPALSDANSTNRDTIALLTDIKKERDLEKAVREAQGHH